MEEPATQREPPRESSADSNAAISRETPETAHVVEVLEHQLRHMAFSLHDGPVQTLSAAGAMLERTVRSEQLDTIHAQIAAAEGLIDYAVSEMREIMQELRPVELDETTLVCKLGECARRFETHAGIPVTVRVEGTEVAFGYDVQVSLFRVVQEALANVRKHANAHAVEVGIEFAEDAVECTVRDDGIGFDPDRATALGESSHWGLAGMRERMFLVGGEVEVASAQDGGTEVRARVRVPGA